MNADSVLRAFREPVAKKGPAFNGGGRRLQDNGPRSTAATDVDASVAWMEARVRQLDVAGQRLPGGAWGKVPSHWDDSWLLIEGHYENGYAEILVNGERRASQCDLVRAPSGSRTLTLGSCNCPTRAFFLGDLAEVAMFNTALSDESRQSIRHYFREKYNSFWIIFFVMFSLHFQVL